ncbi:T-complex protein 11-domain-containing protein [Cyathus striatus]|nr:T-complex protein 11-domain-containing protein [Cyathus striatus]
MEEHSAQAAFLRSVFDPALIEQELEHNLFDPSGLFRTIGVTLKKHCAPMRDSAVETMVSAAQSCAPGGPGTKADAVKAVRLCMEILELMKLDIANHQLQALRPFLIRTAGQFELKTLKNRSGGEGSLHLTREWIHNAHNCLASRTQPLTHPQYPDHLNFNNTLSRNQQIYLSVLKGTVDLVFNPPPAISSPSSPVSPTSPLTPNSPLSFSAFPETFHLDTSRLLHFNSDATDVTAMCMFLLLYRQLVNSDTLEPGSHDRLKVSDGELMRLKREIRDIANTKLGVCFSASSLNSVAADAADLKNSSEVEKWMEIKQSVVLQIAKRAKDARCQPHSVSASGDAPDERLLNIAQRWADSTMQPGSSLSVLLHDRLRDTVFNAVVGLTYPGPKGSAPCVHSLPSGKTEFSSSLPLNLASGMEPLADEIRSLSEKISRLAIIHLNAYLPLYEKDGFLRP